MPIRKPMIEGDNGWTDWITPNMAHYSLECCDCGLVHTLEFRVVAYDLPGTPNPYRVEFRARRNMRATGQVRRYKKRT